MNLHLLFGRVSETGTDGRVKVEFPSHDIVSHFIPVLFQKAKGDFEVWPMDVNTCVACLMDAYCEDGVVLGAIYTDNDTPPEGVNKDKWLRVYKDGSKEYYDRAASERYFKVGDSILSIKDGLFEFNGGTKGGVPEKDKVKANDDSIKTYVTALKAAISAALTTIDASAGSASSGAFTIAMAALSMTVTDVANPKVKH